MTLYDANYASCAGTITERMGWGQKPRQARLIKGLRVPLQAGVSIVLPSDHVNTQLGATWKDPGNLERSNHSSTRLPPPTRYAHEDAVCEMIYDMCGLRGIVH